MLFCGFHLRKISQEMLVNAIRNMWSRIALLKLISQGSMSSMSIDYTVNTNSYPCGLQIDFA